MINFAAKKSREMLASYLSPIVEGYAKKYLSNVPDLQLSLWGGDIVLQNIAVRVQALEEELKRMALPITLQSGFIRELRVHIPWTALTSESVEVWINSIEIVASAAEREPVSEDPTRPTEVPKKKDEEGEGEEGWIKSLVRKIKHNVIVHVKDLNITYIDSDASVIASASCQEISCYPTDGNWLKAFLDVTPQSEIRRACKVDGFSLSMDAYTKPGKIGTLYKPVVEDLDLDVRIFLSQLEQKFAEGPPAKGNEVGDGSEVRSVRQQRIDIHTGNLPVFLHLDQYRQLLGIIDNYKQRAAAAKRSPEKPNEALASPAVTAKSISASADPQGPAGAQGENKGWLSWAWDIMVEEDPLEESEKERRANSPPTEIQISLFAAMARLSLSNVPPLPPTSPPLSPATESNGGDKEDFRPDEGDRPRLDVDDEGNEKRRNSLAATVPPRKIFSFDEFGCFDVEGFAVGISLFKNFDQSKPPVFDVGVHGLNYRTKHRPLVSCRSEQDGVFSHMPHSLFWNAEEMQPELNDASVWSILNAVAFSFGRKPLAKHLSELVVGIPHFQPPLFMHLDFAFSPLSVTYDEEALKSLINFFVPPRRERAVSTALDDDTPSDVAEFLRRLWLSSPPMVLDVRLSRSSGRLVPGCRQGLHEENDGEPSMVVSCDTLRFSNADSFPSVQHFAVPPTFNTNEIYNGFLLQTEGLTVTLDGPTGYATQLLVSPVSGKFLFNKSFLGDLHSLLTQNKKPAKQFLISNSSPFTIKLTKPQIELIKTLVLSSEPSAAKHLATALDPTEPSIELSLGLIDFGYSPYSLSGLPPAIDLRFSFAHVTGWGYPVVPGAAPSDSPLLLLTTVPNREEGKAAADAFDLSLRLPPSTEKVTVGDEAGDSHVRLHTSGLSLVYCHIVHDWISWLAATFISKSSKPDEQEGHALATRLTTEPVVISATCPEDGFFFRYSALQRARQSLAKKLERWRPLQLDVGVHNLHLAVSSIWHDENLADDPAVVSIHLPQLSLTSSAPATPEAPTIWRLRLTDANVHTISSLSASLFPTFARHFPTMPSPAHHRLLSGFSISGSLLLHAGDSPAACPSKVDLKSEIDGGEVKLSADSLATCRYLFASLKCSLLSLRRPKSPVTMSKESGLDDELKQASAIGMALSLEIALRSLSVALVVGPPTAHLVYIADLQRLEVSMLSAPDHFKSEVSLGALMCSKHNQVHPFSIQRLVSLPARGTESERPTPFLSGLWEARWSAQGCPRSSLNERIIGQLRDSSVVVSAADLAAILSLFGEATVLLPLPSVCVNLPVALPSTPRPTHQPHDAATLHGRPTCRAAGEMAIQLSVSKTEVVLVGGDDQKSCNGRLLCSFTSLEVLTEGQPKASQSGDQASTSAKSQQQTDREDTIVLKVTDLTLLDVSSTSTSTSDGGSLVDFAIPVLNKSGIKLNVKLQRKGGACTSPGVAATNVDIILSSQPSFNLVMSQRHLRLLSSIARAVRSRPSQASGLSTAPSTAAQTHVVRPLAMSDLSVFFSLPEVSLCLSMDAEKEEMGEEEYLRVLLKKVRGVFERRGGPSPSSAYRISLGHLSIDRSRETNRQLDTLTNRLSVFGHKSSGTAPRQEKPLVTIHVTQHLHQASTDRKWLVVECQPFYANLDAPLLRFVAGLLSLAKAGSSTSPEAHKKRGSDGTDQRSGAMGIKLFLTGIELVVADDLRSPTSLPVRSVLHQLFVSTHMDAEFELVTKPPANAMIQPSQMYEVTVVGLEVQVPRTNSYILHPCDLRVSITHHLPTKEKKVSFDIEVSAQELISRFGNSHLVALSQLRSLAAAFASATDKTPTVAPPTVGQGDIDHTNCGKAAHPSAIPHQWLLIHSLKMASERNRRPTAYEVTFSDDQSPTSWMAWRYGEARVIKHVVTSPLPLTPPNAEMDRLGKQPLQCSLRYWDDIRSEYIELTTFPLLYRKDDRNKLVECIKLEKGLPAREWQVCIANVNQLTGFSPTMLGLSIGVEDVCDDAFEPKISLSVSVSKAQCSLFNQLTLVDRQEDFGAVHFEDAVVRLAKWGDGQLRANARAKGWVDAVNFRDLTQRHLIEPFRLDVDLRKPSSYQSKHWPDQDTALRATIQTSPVELNVTQSVVDTAVRTALGWHTSADQFLASATERHQQGPVGMYSAYVLINDTQCDLCYGQYHTEEELILPALSRSSYYWRTHRVKLVQQRLKFWSAVDKRRSVQVNIDFVAARTPLVVPFGKQDFLFFVSVEDVGGRREITLRGAHEVYNHLPYPVQAVLQPSDASVPATPLSIAPHGGLCTFALPCAPTEAQQGATSLVQPCLLLRPAEDTDGGGAHADWAWSSPLPISFVAAPATTRPPKSSALPQPSTSLVRVTRKKRTQPLLVDVPPLRVDEGHAEGKCFWFVKQMLPGCHGAGEVGLGRKGSIGWGSQPPSPPAYALAPLLPPTVIELRPLFVLRNDTGFTMTCRATSLLRSIMRGEADDYDDADMLALAPLASAALDLDPLTHPQLSFAMNDQRQRKHHDDSDDDAAAWSTPPYSLDMSLVDEIREWEGALYAKGDAAVGNDDSDSPEELERLLTVVREKKIVREAVTSQYLSHESELAAMKNRESRKGKEKLADDDDHGGGKKAIAVPLRVIASLDNDPGNRIRSSPTILLSISFAFTLANETSQPIYFRRQPTAVELAPSAEEQPQHVCIHPQRRVGFDFYAATKDQGKRVGRAMIQIGLDEDGSRPGDKIAWSSPFSLAEQQLKVVSVLFPSSRLFSQYLLSILPPTSAGQAPHTTQVVIRSRFRFVNRTSLPLAIRYSQRSVVPASEEAAAERRETTGEKREATVSPGHTLLLNGFSVTGTGTGADAAASASAAVTPNKELARPTSTDAAQQRTTTPLLAFHVSVAEDGRKWGWSPACSLTQNSSRGRLLVPCLRPRPVETSQSGGAEDEESLVSPAPVLLTYSVVTRDGATTVVVWRDQFPPFKLVNACPFPIYYAQYHDDRRRMERTKCAVSAGQMVEYDWMWKESTTLPRRTDPSEARPDGSDKGNDNEEEQQEDAEEEQEQLEKQNEKETPKTRAEDLLEPKAWSLNRLCVRTGESAWSREFPIDRARAQTLTLAETERRVDVRVVPCGPTFVVYFDDPSTKPTAAIERNADHHATTASDRHPTATAVKSGGFKVDFAVPLLSLSFLAPPELHAEDWNTGSPAAVPASTTYHTLIETVNTSLDDVRLSFVSTEGPSADSPLQQGPLETTKRQSVSLSISSFQVDNHMPFYDFPVVALSNASSSSSHASVSSSSPAVACTLERAFFPVHHHGGSPSADDKRQQGKWCIEDLSLRFGKGIILNVEDAFVQHIVAALRALVARSLELHHKLKEDLAATFAARLADRDGRPAETVNTTAGDVSQPVDEKWIDEVMAMPFFLRNLLISKLDLELTLHARMALSLGLAHTPLSFDEVQVSSISCAPRRLLEAIAARYVADSLFRTPAVLGSLELLGNPTVLVNSVATGIYDFFALPATGAKEAGVLGFMSGLGRGLSSLVMHVSEGTLTSVSDLSSSLMRNVDNLSLDSDYVRYNKMRLRNAPEQVHTGFARGLQGFGEGVIDGAMGLVAHPIAGLSDGGLTGAVKGLGIGVMGAISKPLSGAVGLLAQTSQGALGSAGLGRYRLYQRHAMPKALEPASNARMKYIVKIFEERKQRELRQHAGAAECGAAPAWVKDERFVHAMDATLLVGESGSQLSANLVLSSQYLYVVVHDSIRHVASLPDVVDVKERTQDDRKLLLLTLRAAPIDDSTDSTASSTTTTSPPPPAAAEAVSTFTFVIPKRSAKSAFIAQLAHLQTRA